MDAATGERILPDFVTDDLVKGSLSLDPDGYPLVYSGSRDGYFRILSYDGDKPKELWKLDGNTVRPKYGDDDWDSAGLIIDDYLFQNSENGNFHVIKLNRGYDVGGKVTVAPELLYHIPSWDSELQKVASDFSVENSVAIHVGRELAARITGCAYLHETRDQRLTDHAAVTLGLAVDTAERLETGDPAEDEAIILF